MDNNATPPRKEDTAERLAYIAANNILAKNLISADDYNSLSDRIRILWGLSFPNPANFHPDSKIELGTIEEPFVDYINANGPYIFKEPSFVTFTTDDVNYIYGFIGFGATYGADEAQVSEAMFILLERSDEVSPVINAPYKIYKALLTQVGTNAPTAIVLENTLGVVPVYAHAGFTGTFSLTVPNPLFDPEKTIIDIQNPPIPEQEARASMDSLTQIWIITYFGGGTTPANGFLNLTPIEIRVYN